MKTESNKNAEQLVPFLDSQIQTLFGITPDIIPSVSTLDDKNRSRWIQSSVEKDTSKLVEVLEQTEPGSVAQDSVIQMLICYYRQKHPAATEFDLCRLAFHCGVWTIMDKLSIAEWQDFKERSAIRQRFDDEKLVQTLSECKNNRTHAAKELGVSLRTVQRRIEDLPPEKKKMVEKENESN